MSEKDTYFKNIFRKKFKNFSIFLQIFYKYFKNILKTFLKYFKYFEKKLKKYFGIFCLLIIFILTYEVSRGRDVVAQHYLFTNIYRNLQQMINWITITLILRNNTKPLWNKYTIHFI